MYIKSSRSFDHGYALGFMLVCGKNKAVKDIRQ